MKNKPTTRKEKIQLLKDLQQGKVSMGDIMPQRVELWFKKKGIYRNDQKALVFDEEQWEEYCQRNQWKNVRLLVFVNAAEEPLDNEDDY
ncbi:MAG: hypothetical protein WKF97_13935 [Chitinophagaceae bacterium]